MALELTNQDDSINNSGLMRSSEVLAMIIEELKMRYDTQDILLKDYIESEIANDSDFRKRAIGYMRYESFIMIPVGQANRKTWAIAVGKKSGQYPGEHFQSDLVAIRLENDLYAEQAVELFLTKMGRNKYFQNTLLISTTDDSFEAFKFTNFGLEALKALPSANFANQPVEIAGYEIYDFNPAYIKRGYYDKSQIAEIVDIILKKISRH